MNRSTPPVHRAARRLGLIAGIGSLLAVSACGGTDDEASGEARTIRIGHLFDANHPYHACGFQPMADEINAGDSGLTVQIFPNGQLGDEAELLQSVQAGDIDMHVPGPGAVANFYRPIGVLDAAYAVDDFDHLRRVWEGEVGDEMRAGTEEAGIRMLDAWYFGVRHMTSDRPVRAPEDLAGVKVRAIDTPVSLANTAAMGAEPVPVSFNELYVALSQGVADGQENPIPTVETLRLYEVQSHLSMTSHLVQSGLVVLSAGTWDAMSEEQREVLSEAVERYGQDVTQCTIDAEQDLVDTWREDGAFTEILMPEDIDLEAFRERVANEVPEQFADVWGDGLYEEIRTYAE